MEADNSRFPRDIPRILRVEYHDVLWLLLQIRSTFTMTPLRIIFRKVVVVKQVEKICSNGSKHDQNTTNFVPWLGYSVPSSSSSVSSLAFADDAFSSLWKEKLASLKESVSPSDSLGMGHKR